jgi:hypothetical protein
MLPENSLQNTLQLNPVRHTLGIAVETRVAGEVRQRESAAQGQKLPGNPLDHRAGRQRHARLHLLVVASTNCDVTISCRERLVRHYARMFIAQALRLLPRRQPVGCYVGEREHLRFKQRRFNVLPASRAPAAAPVLQSSTPALHLRHDG